MESRISIVYVSKTSINYLLLTVNELINLINLLRASWKSYNYNYKPEFTIDEKTGEIGRMFFDIENIPRNKPNLIYQIIDKLIFYYNLPKNYTLTFNKDSNHLLSYHLFFPVAITKYELMKLIFDFHYQTNNEYIKYFDLNIYKYNQLFRCIYSGKNSHKFFDTFIERNYHKLINGSIKDTIVQYYQDLPRYQMIFKYDIMADVNIIQNYDKIFYCNKFSGIDTDKDSYKFYINIGYNYIENKENSNKYVINFNNLKENYNNIKNLIGKIINKRKNNLKNKNISMIIFNDSYKNKNNFEKENGCYKLEKWSVSFNERIHKYIKRNISLLYCFVLLKDILIEHYPNILNSDFRDLNYYCINKSLNELNNYFISQTNYDNLNNIDISLYKIFKTFCQYSNLIYNRTENSNQHYKIELECFKDIDLFKEIVNYHILAECFYKMNKKFSILENHKININMFYANKKTFYNDCIKRRLNYTCNSKIFWKLKNSYCYDNNNFFVNNNHDINIKNIKPRKKNISNKQIEYLLRHKKHFISNSNMKKKYLNKYNWLYDFYINPYFKSNKYNELYYYSITGQYLSGKGIINVLNNETIAQFRGKIESINEYVVDTQQITNLFHNSFSNVKIIDNLKLFAPLNKFNIDNCIIDGNITIQSKFMLSIENIKVNGKLTIICNYLVIEDIKLKDFEKINFHCKEIDIRKEYLDDQCNKELSYEYVKNTLKNMNVLDDYYYIKCKKERNNEIYNISDFIDIFV